MTRLGLLAAALLAIAGCSQFGSGTGDPRAELLWSSRQQAAAEFDSWDMRARAALRIKGEAYQINFSWERAAEGFNMLLEAPFGQGVFSITASGDGFYRLRLPDGQTFVNRSPEALLEQVVGWSLPLGGLEYWIRGMPQPGADYSRRIDGQGRTRSIGQDRWEISYLDYFDAQAQPQLPRRIRLTRGELILKLVIERWQAPSDEPAETDLFPEFN